jgi:hypothetical protein
LAQRRMQQALARSEYLRYVVIMELAVNSFADADSSLKQLGMIVKYMQNSFVFGATYRSQVLADLHTVCLSVGDDRRKIVDGLIARVGALV